MRELRQSVIGLQRVVESSITEQTRVSTWMISCMTQLMDASGRTYQAFDSTLEVLLGESSSTEQPLEQVQNHNEDNVFANKRRHSEQPESINDTYVLVKDDSNVTPDSSNICNNDNQVDQNAAECIDERDALESKRMIDESSRALGEATSSRDSSLIALQTKQTELQKYTALNDLTSDYKILQTKLNETLGLLALKDIDIQQ
ncbi:hypothetical protein Tco_1298717, partial [Tanacetum coccineum]